jgi:copper homeostasis protein CutC|tara:strand:+ start:1186 stop:1506 length:321 start_codon:yes stop_codon:yes gene_type:complete
MLQDKLTKYKPYIVRVVVALVVLVSVIYGAVTMYQDTGKIDVGAAEEIITAAEDLAEAADAAIEAMTQTTTIVLEAVPSGVATSTATATSTPETIEAMTTTATSTP